MAVSDKPKEWEEAWALHNLKINELQSSKSYLEEELTATKRALLMKEDKIEELLSTVAHLEGKLRLNSKRSTLRNDLLEAIERSVRHAFDGESHDLELCWNTAFACLGEAISHKATVERIGELYNKTILKYEAELKEERKLRGSVAAQISVLNDTVDANTFELNRVKRDRDEAVARSQRQASRITDMESQIERLKTEWDGTVQMAKKLDKIRAILDEK